MCVVLGADIVFPARTWIRIAIGPLLLDVRPGQRIVEHGDLVPKDVGVVLVEIDTFLDHGLAVAVERDAARVVATGVSKKASLDFEDVVSAAAVVMYPLADRDAGLAHLAIR